MSYSQKEKVIRERRTSLAVKNNMMGPSGKIGIIVKALGNPIMSQGSSYVDTYYLEDPYADFTDTEYEKTLSGQNGPVAWQDRILEDESGAGVVSDDNPNFLGYVFDGLSRGIHIEIQYMRHEHTLKVYYKGYEVYKEIAGELEAYNPFPEWEESINKLYKNAKEKSKEIKEQEFAEFSEAVERKKTSFWQRLRMRWGV
jgi:hypothetical protein